MSARAHGTTNIPLKCPPLESLGPKMQALKTDRQRQFVWSMLQAPTPTAASKMAGYSRGAVTACELMQNEAVLEAIHEVAWKHLNGFGLKSIRALERIIDDPDHPKHLVAIGMALDRTGFAAQTEHKVTVEHRVDELQMKALAARFSDQYGVPAAKLLGHDGETIEGEVARETAETHED